MMIVLVFITTIAVVGLALYAMVCERVEANRQRRATELAVHTETVAVFPAAQEPSADVVLVPTRL